MGNLKFEREDDRMVKVMNCEEYDEWREQQVQFLRKRDKWQFIAGIALFLAGSTIIITTPFKCCLALGIGFLLVFSGAAVALTSKLCMKV
jgi:hypothetical protein